MLQRLAQYFLQLSLFREDYYYWESLSWIEVSQELLGVWQLLQLRWNESAVENRLMRRDIYSPSRNHLDGRSEDLAVAEEASHG